MAGTLYPHMQPPTTEWGWPSATLSLKFFFFLFFPLSSELTHLPVRGINLNALLWVIIYGILILFI